MEATALSLGKSVLDGALGYAKSALAEEVALQLGIQRDHAFIRDELQMMKAFLMAADDGHDRHKVLMAWVKQVRDVAYDAEDCLQDFSIHLKEPSWWRLPPTLRERRRIAKQMKELRARVEDVSQRNLRYQLIKSSNSKPATVAEISSITTSTVFGVVEEEPTEDLVSLIKEEGEDLGVIALWGASGDHGLITIINAAYENPDIKKKYSCRAWVRISHPLNPTDFIQSLVKQFRSAEGVNILLDKEKTGQALAEEFTRRIKENGYLVVLNDISTFEEWSVIKTCFTNSKKGSRIIATVSQVEVARLCAGQDNQVVKLKQFSADQTIYAFFQKDSMKLPLTMPNSHKASTNTNNPMACTNDLLGNQSQGLNERKVVMKSLTRIKTIASALEESELVGREREKSDIVNLLLNQSSQELLVISVWGMGGLGKTTLVKDVYQSQTLINMFDKRAFVTMLRPFNLKELLEILVMQVSSESSESKKKIDLGYDIRKKLALMRVDELIGKMAMHMKEKTCFIVLDDLSSTEEWDNIIKNLPKLGSASRILVTTREQSIAKYCSEKQENIYPLKVLDDVDALNLFTRKVFKEATESDKHLELVKEAEPILKKCNGLPIAIVTIGGFLANQPKIASEWRKLNDHISAELEVNQELKAIPTILGKSYDGLPYHLKSCFLYMSIFPKDHKISRRRLIRRWTAEGYSREVRGKSAEEISDSYFMELIGRSMILPSQKSVCSRKKIDSCQVHDLMREISISKSTDENLVLRLDEGSGSHTQEIVRHLAISSNWKGDKREFESAVDLSRVRSLTVFGEWRSFYISNKLRLLRVLDLENTTCLLDHHLEHIGSLLHLKYISLRGCKDIYLLPDSWGNLLQLETLDVKNTCICELPKSITKLRKLQYIFGGNYRPVCINLNERVPDDLMKLCVACCSPKFLQDVEGMHGDPNIYDVCTFWRHIVFPTLVSRRLDPYGVVLPKGVRKLKSLHTLGAVSIARGKGILREIRRLTHLRKLAVRGINKKNCKEFCSTLADLTCLESLSVSSEGVFEAGVFEAGEFDLDGLLDGASTPLSNLQSLKLYGKLVKLTEWIGGLQNLVKLKLAKTCLLEADGTMQILRKLPNLSILSLYSFTFGLQEDGELRLTFRHFPEEVPFASLTVLELCDINGRIRVFDSVEFEKGAAPNLELLRFCGLGGEKDNLFSGLADLPMLKEFQLDNHSYSFEANVQAQLAENPNKPIFKKSPWWE